MQATTRAISWRARTLLGLPLPTMSLFVLFLAAVDAWTTHLLLSQGLGWEFNPLMDWVYRAGGAAALLVLKLLLTGACLLWIERRASYVHARMASVAALGIYVPVTGLHIAGLY